jgi:hypothetical protein
LGEGRGYRIPLPLVYQAFPDLLQPLDSISAEAQAETRAQRWRERAMRIRDDALSWTLCVREWKEAEEEVEEGSDLDSISRRHVQVCRDRADRELLNLAWRIYFEGNREEKRRMPHPSEPPVAFVHWAKQEAKSTDRSRWTVSADEGMEFVEGGNHLSAILQGYLLQVSFL